MNTEPIPDNFFRNGFLSTYFGLFLALCQKSSHQSEPVFF